MAKHQIITAAFGNGGGTRRLLVEDKLPEGGYSVTDLDHGGFGERFYHVSDDGIVGDDRGDGDWLGEVTDWGTT